MLILTVIFGGIHSDTFSGTEEKLKSKMQQLIKENNKKLKEIEVKKIVKNWYYENNDYELFISEPIQL